MSKAKLFLFAIPSLLVLWLFIVVVVDASKLYGVELQRVDENNYLVRLHGEEYVLRFVPKENIHPLFGKAINEFGTRYALVRNDLPPRVQKSVAYHEIYHHYDFQNNLHQSRLSQEIHANLASIPYEPIGYLQTVFLTLTDKDRRAFYLHF